MVSVELGPIVLSGPRVANQRRCANHRHRNSRRHTRLALRRFALHAPPQFFDPMRTVLRFIAVAGMIAFATGCSTVTDFVLSNVPHGETGPSSIVVRLGEQRAYLYKGGKQVAVSRVSTGRKGYRTPRGTFKVIRKHKDHRSSLYGDYVDDYGWVVKANVDSRKHRRPPGSRFEGAPMPYYIEFTPSYGFHGGDLPGYPASHGCVRMPYWKARQFYHAVKIGTPVIIKS